jgi:hypothetical protein
MTDVKKKAERPFNWQTIKESVERMKPELIAASEAAHEAKHAALARMTTSTAPWSLAI